MRHRGAHVGDFFVSDKEGRAEFTDDDEEVLKLFAAQAATVIANARTHQGEHRARKNQPGATSALGVTQERRRGAIGPARTALYDADGTVATV